MESIGTTALSVSLEWLINYLGSKSIGWWNSRSHVRDDLENWKRFLPKLNAVLDDAEKKQTTNRAVELWFSDLRDVAYDMEDVLDGLEADERRKKLTAKIDQPSTSKKRKWIPTFVTGFNRDDFILDHEVNKIKEVSVRLERIMKEKEALDLKVGEARSSIAAPPREQTTWLPEPYVYGREADKDAVLQKVLNDEDGDENPCVIPIVGMGGLGKTTLARLVYNDARLNGVFHPKAWVCVSDEFDVDRIIRSILEQISPSNGHFKDPSVLQGQVNQELSGKKFLLVLDDVWSEDCNCWDVLQRVIRSGAVGSKIVVTSRIKGVAKTMGATDRIYHLKELPENQCLSLLARQALRRENFDPHLELLDVAEKIVGRCRGLPLAIKTLGGVLRDELNPKKWAEVLNSEMWELPEGRRHILPALRLSYHHLPAHLKKCFAYCALFPKDHEFLQYDLVLLWMAEGFVQQQKNGARQMKSLGDQYFYELLSRGLFQQSSSDQSRFVMHDLVHDLAQNVAGETCCNFENVIHSGKIPENFERVRHLSLSDLSGFRQSGFLDKLINLRTLLLLRPSFHPQDDEFFQECLQKLRSLRVLSLCGLGTSELPNSIGGELKHLHYINLSRSAIKSLPNSVRSFVYLQTMKLCWCYKIEELPEGIVDLVDLHHLDISHTEIKKMPPQMGNLKNLLMLPKFIVGESGGLRLKELSNLKDLQGELLIQDLHNVSDDQDASEASLFKMEGLEILTLKWNNDFQTLRDESVELQLKVLSQLKPHSNLKRFTINSYGGWEFPSWISDPSFSKLEYLELRNCQRSTLLPWLGRLPQLKQLIIKDMPEANAMDPEFHGHNNSSCDSFPLLEMLILLDCPQLIGKLPSHIPSLKSLTIQGCPQLRYSPMSLPSLQKLNLDYCNGVVLGSVFDSTSLTQLLISRISELTCLPRSITQYGSALETLGISECGDLTFLLEDRDSLSSFSRMEIKSCDSPERLPNGLHSLTCLQELRIQQCEKFVGFPVTDFPLHLQRLKLTDLEALELLPDELVMTTKGVCISNCPRLKSFSTGELLARLEESLPDVSLPSFTLETLVINNCDNLESLPNGMYNCTSLQDLEIRDCPGIASIPRGGLPPNLKRLEIDCKSLEQSMLEWGLDRLMSLEKFEIHRICPPDDFLPISLKTLIIRSVGNLESISNRLLQNLSSLRRLEIKNCPILENLPSEGLPPSLEVLEINGCPLLEPRCLDEKGDYWPLISHIPEIYIGASNDEESSDFGSDEEDEEDEDT